MIRLLIFSAVAILIFDVAAALAARAIGFSYGYASVGKLVIYLAAAFLASRKFGFGWALLVGLVLGLTDATLGWAASWAIGPGRLQMDLTPRLLRGALAGTTMVSLVCAVIGGGAGALARRLQAPS